ncbi:MAG: hypothetical protein BWX88_02971 [Planctomycetes bacterium ADurb.Bin126]|mgnify:CR=1 FL=1|nr:MAG: hypothetical protein BWX88_02971 [Planctomycetes bacterium ADurb.Bin126]HOD81598.1 hypothetical protein [Phycisphaerae bacterium]HQL71849.1 hypothetical protein [Phycisphaerae bacterium]
MRVVALSLVTALIAAASPAAEAPAPATTPIQPFKIQVVDDQTARGVPLVELKTTNQDRWYTDSAGYVAFNEPGLMNRKVFFTVTSHGYQFPKDGFGMAGRALDVKPGGAAVLRIKRLNVAERLYRVTGQGIYRDSVLLGLPAPIRQPTLNAEVTGQDSVMTAIYRDKLYWFWGDTNRVRYPLGHFQMSGATSLLPGKGGLPPSQGVNLDYFVDAEGFSRKMAPMTRPGQAVLVWLDGFVVVPDAAGQQRMAAHYAQLKGLGHVLEHGLMLYNDRKEIFEKVLELPQAEKWRHPQGRPVRWTDGGKDYYVFPAPYPVVRAPATLDALKDMSAYEAFTCLKPGSRFDKSDPPLHRDQAGKLVWAWKANTDPITQEQEADLIKARKIKPDEARFQLRDIEGGKTIKLQGGTFHPNACRKKWIMVGLQVWGSSMLGEVWFAQADSPAGPWTTARKIVTHDKYSFYHPCHHPYFDEEGGRIIYFDGTYTATFSGNEHPTPRYDYNQIMYRLDLADPRLRMD